MQALSKSLRSWFRSLAIGTAAEGGLFNNRAHVLRHTFGSHVSMRSAPPSAG